MLAARGPFLGFHTPPRVISEIRKPTPAWPRDNVRPRITGELLCCVGGEGRWRVRRVAVRSGQLQVCEDFPRLALRRLSLSPGPVALSFGLSRGPDSPPLLTLQATSQQEFDVWVKTIAIELIRQTPLDAIKYLDILTLTPQPKKPASVAKDCNHNCLPDAAEQKSKRCRSLDYHELDENKNYKLEGDEVDGVHSLSILPGAPPGKTERDEHTVELLLKRCQNSDSYVPVKEKLKLFESLCRLERLITDETCPSKYGNKRTRSLHDLSNSGFPSIGSCGVKQICQYFETKNDESRAKDAGKYNSIARGSRTSFGPVKTIISRKYSVQKNCSAC